MKSVIESPEECEGLKATDIGEQSGYISSRNDRYKERAEHVDKLTKESLREFETSTSFIGMHRKQLSMDDC